MLEFADTKLREIVNKICDEVQNYDSQLFYLITKYTILWHTIIYNNRNFQSIRRITENPISLLLWCEDLRMMLDDAQEFTKERCRYTITLSPYSIFDTYGCLESRVKGISPIFVGGGGVSLIWLLWDDTLKSPNGSYIWFG